MGWLDLSGKVVIVTGGSGGIGEKIIENLTANGAYAIIADLTENISQRKNPLTTFIKCDVSEKLNVDTMVKTVYKKYGRIDSLVNNAGVGRIGLLVDYYDEKPEYEASEDDFDFMVSVNQKGVFLCTQAVVRVMLKQKSGVIINITSEAGIEGSKCQSIYAGTKAAVHAMGLSWAKELGPYNIRVVGIEPAMNERTNLGGDQYPTAMAYTRRQNEGSINSDYTSKIPLGRLGKLSELADLTSFIISDHSSYITGTTINITGGKSKG
ncbi:MAG: sorbitol-6-phosphate dehydrogenase subunit [Oscillospiraceae bacterium]|nr:sorbitol-6-phosphate dehydrogenase subunit [Oscillospiraceae bacterium]